MTNRKLQKLCCCAYAEAWHQTLFNESLISGSEFEAWRNGPISPILYQKYKDYDWIDIPQNKDKDIRLNENLLNDKQALYVLNSILLTYFDKSDNELEILSSMDTSTNWV